MRKCTVQMHELRGAPAIAVVRLTFSSAELRARPPAEFHFPFGGKRKPAAGGARWAGPGAAARRAQPDEWRTRPDSISLARPPQSSATAAQKASSEFPTQQSRFDAGAPIKASSVLIWKFSFQERYLMGLCSYAI